ncbi:MAG: hypothetical protein WC476_05075 [Phycisphaerae bacterium]|jgi:hypothetical protein
MTEKGYKGGLVSRVKNKYSGKRYVISTAQEIGMDYWATVLFPGILFGLLPALTKKIFTVVRNNKEDAHLVHRKIKEIVINTPESNWLTEWPVPEPPEGWSEDAKKKLEEKLGESERLINFMQENPEQGEVIKKDFKDFLNQPHIKDLTKDVFREMTKGPEDEQN